MERKTIISEQPTCITCGKLMKEWNPYAEVHEHGKCSSERMSENLGDFFKKQLGLK